jgi:hypothetical protein
MRIHSPLIGAALGVALGLLTPTMATASPAPRQPAAATTPAPVPTTATDPATGPAHPAGAAAAQTDEVAALRRELEALRQQVKLLQDQIAALTAATPAAGAAAAPAAPTPLAPVPPQVQITTAPAAGGSPRTRIPSLLNPALSAVFQAVGDTSLVRRDEANGFDLSEAELALQSEVDPFTRVDLFLTFPNGAAPEVEEGVVSTLALPGPLQVKGGRFKSAFGKWNTYHNHAFFTVDRPDALTSFLGEESFTNDGLSLSVLIPNPWDLYIDAITEVGTARENPEFNSAGRHLTYLQHLAAFFDTSPDSTLEFGLTAAFGKTGPTESLLDAIDTAGLGSTLSPRQALASRLYGVDVTYKWKPRRLNVYKSFLWQTEALRSRRDLDRLTPAMTLLADRASSLGGYSYVEYQLAKRWRVGARYDWTEFPDAAGERLWAGSGVIRYQPSEFQELRFQIKRTVRNDAAAALFGGDASDTRLFFEWIPVIGAHGAHKY